MTKDDLVKVFPAQGSLDECAPRLLGGQRSSSLAAAGAEEKPMSRCTLAMDLAGFSEKESADAVKACLDVSQNKPVEGLAAAVEYVVAQVRGSVRAGVVTEQNVMKAAGELDTPQTATLTAAVKLVDGARKFTKLQSSRRPLCAALVEECDGFDPEKVRKYVLGEYSYGRIDGLARQRCGPCRGKFVRRERMLQTKFIGSAGALAGLGLARAGKPEPIDPASTKAYAVYTSRSKLDSESARLGVLIANGVVKAEEHWKGTITLGRGNSANDSWDNAIVWLRDGKVAKVLVNIKTATEDLSALLDKHYGTQGTKDGSTTTWKLGDGVVVKLVLGSRMSLVISKE